LYQPEHVNDTPEANLDLPPAPHRPVPALQCYLAYAAALLVGAVAWWVLQGRGVIEDPFWIGFAVTCASTVVIWAFSVANDNSSIYDPYWVIAPPILALALKATAGGGLLGEWSARQICVVACLWIWGTRYHTMYSWSGWRTGLVHEDWRYEEMRSAPVPYWLNSLTGMHLFPTVLVYFAFAPAALVLIADPSTQPALGPWDALGLIGALSAVAIELFADEQLRKYRASGAYAKGGTLRRGLWKFSRHPNYFGEVLFWLSMIPFAVPGGFLSRYPALVLIGPIMMAIFFRFSCWLMDVRSIERRPEYQQVVDEVSAMVPWWPKKLPSSVP
jgi:steroid 5-alpha reductase family enzyme